MQSQELDGDGACWTEKVVPKPDPMSNIHDPCSILTPPQG